MNFFDGNPEEDSIAPNQWGYGRPSLAEMRDMLRRIELMPNVAWVRVALHDDTEIREENGTEVLDLAGDSIVICTGMKPEELEKAVNCEWLCSDGVIESNPCIYYSCIPPIPIIIIVGKSCGTDSKINMKRGTTYGII